MLLIPLDEHENKLIEERRKKTSASKTLLFYLSAVNDKNDKVMTAITKVVGEGLKKDIIYGEEQQEKIDKLQYKLNKFGY